MSNRTTHQQWLRSFTSLSYWDIEVLRKSGHSWRGLPHPIKAPGSLLYVVSIPEVTSQSTVDAITSHILGHRIEVRWGQSLSKCCLLKKVSEVATCVTLKRTPHWPGFNSVVKPPIGATWALKCFVLFCFGGWPHALPKVLVLWKESGGSKPGGVSHESPTSLLIQGVLLSLADMLHTGTHRPHPSG